MSASPPNPVVGEEVTWSIISRGGANGPRDHMYAWNADINEMPQLYLPWPGGIYPYMKATSVKAKYFTAGTKSVTVAVWSADQYINRTLSLTVVPSRIERVSPNATVWNVGQTYTVTWRTIGKAPIVQVALWDDRYDPNSGNAGELVLANVPNTGSFTYTVPQPHPNGISEGTIGGRHYKVSVTGFGEGQEQSVPGFSSLFTYQVQGPVAPHRRPRFPF